MKDLGPAEEFVAGALGEPGRRTFYIQITAGGETVWLHAEKEQVAALGAQCLSLLAAAELEPDADAVAAIRSELSVREPDEQMFAVGGIQVAVLESELITIIVDSDGEEESVRFVVAPEQLQAMAEVALEVVAAGRPICPRCQLPEDPMGHRCPASNGHHPS